MKKGVSRKLATISLTLEFIWRDEVYSVTVAEKLVKNILGMSITISSAPIGICFETPEKIYDVFFLGKHTLTCRG